MWAAVEKKVSRSVYCSWPVPKRLSGCGRVGRFNQRRRQWTLTDAHNDRSAKIDWTFTAVYCDKRQRPFRSISWWTFNGTRERGRNSCFLQAVSSLSAFRVVSLCGKLYTHYSTAYLKWAIEYSFGAMSLITDVHSPVPNGIDDVVHCIMARDVNGDKWPFQMAAATFL